MGLTEAKLLLDKSMKGFLIHLFVMLDLEKPILSSAQFSP